MQVTILSWEVLEKLALFVTETIDPFAVCEGGKTQNWSKTERPM